MNKYAHISGWGKYVPDQVVTNDDLARVMDTSDEWIRTRTGIRERRMARSDENTASMAINAARSALQVAELSPEQLDLIIVATFTPEYSFPATANLVQSAVGAKRAAAFDLSAGCSGFIYALDMAVQTIRSGTNQHVLVIGAETCSRVIDVRDRNTYVLFGDGAGAVLLSGREEQGGILATTLGSDGEGAKVLELPSGAKSLAASPETASMLEQRLPFIRMNGRAVFRFAVQTMPRAAREVCERAGVPVDNVNLFIPHQANIRIIEAAARSLHLPPERFFMNLDRYGNTSSASIPIALCEAAESGRIHVDDYLVMVGFGAGLSWGATALRWSAPVNGNGNGNGKVKRV